MVIKWSKDGHISKKRFIEIFLLLVIFYFSLAYTVVNRATILDQIEVLKETGSFFAKTTTYSVLKLEGGDAGYDYETYEIELIVYQEINGIRTQNRLSKLEWDPMLSKLARQHSYDMAQNDYFNHTNLFGEGPTRRAKEMGIKTSVETQDKIYIGIGENIGYMPKGIVADVGVLITTEDIASAMVYRWMLSTPHRENILTKEYITTGIGVAYDGKGGYYLTQNFQ